MDTSSVPSDAARELAELRARAYGPDADIQGDPEALRRLRELEAARQPLLRPPERGDDEADASAASGARDPDVRPSDTQGGDVGAWARPDVSLDAATDARPRSLSRPTASTSAGRTTIVVGAVAAALAVGYAVDWFVGPHPDVTLRAVTDTANSSALAMIGFLEAQPDASTIRGYDSYRGIEPWFFKNEQDFHCFMLVTGPTSVDGANCVPPGVELFADITPWRQLVDEDTEPLPAGSIIRFHYRDDRVDVYVYPPSQSN
jgi:hypothetical protein